MQKALFYVIIFSIIAVCLRLWVIEGYTIPTHSMQPTLSVGDWIWIKKLPACPIRKGEIIAFHFPLDKTIKYVKRCIGMPNDSILKINGKYALQRDNPKAFPIPQKGQTININDKNASFYLPLIQNYEQIQAAIIGDKMYINNIPNDTYTFTQNYFYVLGDNPSDSNDSRNWGLVPESYLIGKAFFIWKK
jgi:signal peptidase I